MTQPKVIQDDWQFIAAMELYQAGDSVKAVCRMVGEDEAEVVDVPPQLAGQIPMAIQMIRNGI